MPGTSLREAARLLRYAQGPVSGHVGLSVGVAVVAGVLCLAVEALVHWVIPRDLGAILGFALGVVCLVAVIGLFDLLPLAAFAAAPLLAMALACQPRPDAAPTGGDMRLRALGGGTPTALRRLRRRFRSVTRDIFGLVQGLPQSLPRPSGSSMAPQKTWLVAVGLAVSDVASADVLLAPAADRGQAAQQAAVRLAEVARSLVPLVAWPVVALAAFGFVLALCLWPLCAVAAGTVPGGLDPLSALVLAACLAVQVSRSFGRAVLISAVLPAGLDILHAEAPNVNWKARLEASSPAWRALEDAAGAGPLSNTPPGAQRMSTSDPRV